MCLDRIKALQAGIQNPILIKKKENLLYLTGRSFMHGYLLVKARTGADSNADRRGAIFLGDGLERIEGIKSDFLKNVGKYIGRNQTLEVFGEFTYSEVKYIKFKNPNLKLKVTVKHDPVDYLRMIKEPGEIQLVKKSMQIVEKVFELVKYRFRRERSRPFPTEAKLAEFIKQAGFKLGAEDIVFPPIVASGPNAAIPHHIPSNKKLKAGESIIIDFGFKYKNYCSDFTRTVFLKKVPKKLEMAYNQVEKAYNVCINFVSSSGVIPASEPESRKWILKQVQNDKRITGNHVYQKAVSVLAEKHLDKYFIHSLGHGTGLEIHELPNLSPNSKDILADGMVFSIEPGVYFPRLGGIRIEDLVYLPRRDSRSEYSTRGLEKGKVKKFIHVSTELKNNTI